MNNTNSQMAQIEDKTLEEPPSNRNKLKIVLLDWKNQLFCLGKGKSILLSIYPINIFHIDI